MLLLNRYLLTGICLILSLLCNVSFGAGVTIITHGWNPTSEAPDWLKEMQKTIALNWLNNEQNFGKIVVNAFPYEAKTSSWNFDLTNSYTGEVVIILDWSSVANHLYPTGKTTTRVASLIEDMILKGQNGKIPLAELPIHLIGHSRGGSLICELARRLGERGLIIDHLTPLDPHPLTDDDQPNPFDVDDAPVDVYENTVFADCYYQRITYPKGQYINGAYNREWTSIQGGYYNSSSIGETFADHSNIHLMYFGTICCICARR